MNKDIYLSEVLKAKYLLDFENVKKSKFWPLEDGLDAFLSQINKNPFVQTLYSKKCECKNLGDDKSYLEFCYYEKCEKVLLRQVIPEILGEFNSGEDKFSYYFSYPTHNPNYKEGIEKKGIGCIDDPNYFNINHFRFEYFSAREKGHLEFWNNISKTLSSI